MFLFKGGQNSWCKVDCSPTYFCFLLQYGSQILLAVSQTILIGWFLLKSCISFTACFAFFVSSNALSWLSVQTHSFSLLRSGRSSAHCCAQFGMVVGLADGLHEWTKFFQVFFGFILSVIAWMFSSIGLITVWDNVKSNHSVCFCAILQVYVFRQIPASSSILITSSTFFMCYSLLPSLQLGCHLWTWIHFRYYAAIYPLSFETLVALSSTRFIPYWRHVFLSPVLQLFERCNALLSLGAVLFVHMRTTCPTMWTLLFVLHWCWWSPPIVPLSCPNWTFDTFFRDGIV